MRIKDFFVTVAQKVHPDLLADAAVVLESEGALAQVVGVGGLAAEAGVAIGMTEQEARAFFPAIQVVINDPFSADKAFAEVLTVLESFSPSLEVLGMGNVLLDLGILPDSSRALTIAQHIIGSIRKQARFISSIGLAETRFVAMAAAQVVAPGSYQLIDSPAQEAFLAPLPLSILPISLEIQRRLALLGMHTLSDVSKLSESDLVNQFGGEGSRLASLVTGGENTPINFIKSSEILSHTTSFETPIDGGEYLLEAINQSLESLFSQLKERHQLTSRLRIRLDSVTLSIGLRSPTNDPTRLLSILRERLAAVTLTQAINSIEINLEGLIGEYARQLTLSFLFPKEKKWREIERMVERLSTQPNPPHLMHVVWDDPHAPIPERHAHLQDRVMTSRTRGLYLPRPIKVAADPSGMPRLVRMRSGWTPVEWVMEAWEVDDDWWTSRPIQRTYYRVVLANGGVLRLFRDEVGGGWYQ